MSRPLLSVHDIPVVGDIVRMIRRDKEAEEAYQKMLNRDELTPRDVGLALYYGIKHGKIKGGESGIPEEWRPYLKLVHESPSLLGGAWEDFKRKAVSSATFGVFDKLIEQPDIVPEKSTTTDIAGTIAGALGTAAPLRALAGTGGLISRVGRMGATGGAVGAAKGAIEDEDVGKSAVREALLFGAGEAATGPLNALFKKLGLAKTVTELPEQNISQPSTGRLPSDIKGSGQLIEGFNIGRTVGQSLEDAAAREQQQQLAAQRQRLADVLNKVLEKRTNNAAGQYRYVSPRVPEPPVTVSPAGEAIPAGRLPGILETAPRGTPRPTGISGALPPAGEPAGLLPEKTSLSKKQLEEALNELTGQYRAVSPKAAEPPIVVSPTGEALPASRLTGIRETAPRGTSKPQGITGLLPPVEEIPSLPSREPLALPPAKEILEDLVGQYRAVSPRLSEPPISVSPAGEAIPAQRLSGVLETAPRGTYKGKDVSGLLPPAREPLGLPESIGIPKQELNELAALKRDAALRLHETMINDIRSEAQAMWEAAGKPLGRLEEFVRRIAEKRGYDYDRIIAEISKPLEEHARELEEIIRLGEVSGIAPATDVTKILSSVVGKGYRTTPPQAKEKAIEVAAGYKPRSMELEEAIRRILEWGVKRPYLGKGVQLGRPDVGGPPRRILIPAAERVPKRRRTTIEVSKGLKRRKKVR